MARRKLSERQRERIEAIQARRRGRLETRAAALEDGADETPLEGLVVTRFGQRLAVEDDAGGLWDCLTRQNIGEPVCGDRVVWNPTGEGRGVVTALQPRRSVLARPDYSGREKPLAANITRLAIVIAPQPEPTEYLLDQYLVTVELIGVEALIILNKRDLLGGAEEIDFDRRFGFYSELGYPLLRVSNRTGEGVEAFTRALEGETAILVGQSGVGKSSLIQTLLPDQEIQVGRLSESTGFGRHTTSATTCYHLPGGGLLIDSPGVRSFRLLPNDPAQLAGRFLEFRPFLGHCRFHNCRHDQEPGCALKAAVERGEVRAVRRENYLHLYRQLGGTTS